MSRHPLWSALIAAALIALVGAVHWPLNGDAPDSEQEHGAGQGATAARHSLQAAGWGPRRTAYWCNSQQTCEGAKHVTFDSYVNQSNYGDEREFLIVKPARDHRAGGWRDLIDVRPGEVLLLRIYVDNNAWLPGDAGMAVGTRARIGIPIAPARRHVAWGFISARNSRPRRIWDAAVVRSEDPTVLRFVFGSARWYTNLSPRHGVALPDNLIEEGTSIGSWRLDGRFGDRFADTGIIVLRVRVAAA